MHIFQLSQADWSSRQLGKQPAAMPYICICGNQSLKKSLIHYRPSKHKVVDFVLFHQSGKLRKWNKEDQKFSLCSIFSKRKVRLVVRFIYFYFQSNFFAPLPSLVYCKYFGKACVFVISVNQSPQEAKSKEYRQRKLSGGGWVKILVPLSEPRLVP